MADLTRVCARIGLGERSADHRIDLRSSVRLKDLTCLLVLEQNKWIWHLVCLVQFLLIICQKKKKKPAKLVLSIVYSNKSVFVLPEFVAVTVPKTRNILSSVLFAFYIRWFLQRSFYHPQSLSKASRLPQKFVTSVTLMNSWKLFLKHLNRSMSF